MIAHKPTILENALWYFTVRFICKLTARQNRSQYNEQITRFVKFSLFSNKTRSKRLKNCNKEALRYWKVESVSDCYGISGFLLLCFVALSVRMCVAGANRVEGTMSWCLETNEIWHLIMTLLKVKQRHFETTILILQNFFVYLSSSHYLTA